MIQKVPNFEIDQEIEPFSAITRLDLELNLLAKLQRFPKTSRIDFRRLISSFANCKTLLFESASPQSLNLLPKLLAPLLALFKHEGVREAGIQILPLPRLN